MIAFREVKFGIDVPGYSGHLIQAKENQVYWTTSLPGRECDLYVDRDGIWEVLPRGRVRIHYVGKLDLYVNPGDPRLLVTLEFNNIGKLVDHMGKLIGVKK